MTEDMNDESRSISSIDQQAVLRRMQRQLLGLSDKDAPPPVVGRYRILRRLGRGASAEVFAAWDPDLDREIALKLLRPSKGVSRDRLAARVRREAQAQAKVKGHVVHVYEVGSCLDGLFIAMEKVDGPSLDAWQRERPWQEVLEVYLEAGKGLVAAHDKGIVHKDFKPGNVLVSSERERRVYVADFGLARALSDQSMATDEGDGRREHVYDPTWTVGFTPQYAPPEQMRGRAVDARGDQYAFCVALFEGLFGTPPFVGQSGLALLEAKEAGHLVPFHPGKVPPRIVGALRRGLDAEPAGRFATMRELLSKLEPRSRRMRSLGVMGLAGVLATVPMLQGGDDPCAGYDGAVEMHWNDERRAEVKGRFVATGAPYAASTFEAVAEDLDARFAEWTQRTDLACRAPAQADGYVERLRCLEQQFHSTTALLQRFSQADAEQVDVAGVAVATLPMLDECDRLGDSDSVLPDGARSRLEEQLARAQSAVVTARWLAATEHATIARALARQYDHGRLEIEAIVVLGHALVGSGRVEEGIGLIAEAAQRAEERKDDGLAWRAWLRSVTLAPVEPGQVDRAVDRRLARAEAAAQRLGGDEYRRQRLTFERARIGAVEGGAPAVRSSLEEVWRWLQGHDEADARIGDLRRSVAMSLASNLLSSAPTESVAYAKEAVRLADEQLGEGRPETLMARFDLGLGLLEACLVEEAEAILLPAVDEAAELWPEPHEDRARIYQAMTQLELRRGRIDDARASVEQGLSLTPFDAEFMRAVLVLARANVEFAEGDLAAAESSAAYAMAGFEAAGALGGAAFAHATVAECRLHAGEIDGALVMAERAQKDLEHTMGEGASAYLVVPLKVQGLALLLRGELAEARRRLERARAHNVGCEVLEGAEIAAALAVLHGQAGELDRGAALEAEATAAFESMDRTGQKRRDRLRRLLEPRSEH